MLGNQASKPVLVTWIRARWTCVAIGVLGFFVAFLSCYLIAWGVTLLAWLQAPPSLVFTRPIFWVFLAMVVWFVSLGITLLIMQTKKGRYWQSAYLLIGFISTIGLSYFTSWGIFREVFGEVPPQMVFGKPLFWGLQLMIGGFFIGVLVLIRKIRRIPT